MQALRECDPDLTVIVPVYNLERYIRKLLASLKDQELGEYGVEFIFVLNNCTDGSEDVIRSSGLDCEILFCTEQGCGPARNVGMDAARGEFIWFMDGDDWLLSKTAIRDVIYMAKSNGFNIMRIPFQSDRFAVQYYSMVWQYIMRREFIDEFRFPAIQPAEDDAFMAMVLRKAGWDRTTYLLMPQAPSALYFYNYLREGSNMYRHLILKEKI